MFHQQCSKREKLAQLEIWDRNLGEILRDMFRKGVKYLDFEKKEEVGKLKLNDLVHGYQYN